VNFAAKLRIIVASGTTNMGAIFETNPVFLSGLLGDLKTGKVQLPDFQRGWVWDDERIRGVLASVSRSFPIGALMVLETGGETRFHPRPVEGVELPHELDPELLVLDGQQRLTSLFQATTYGKVVATMNVRKQPVKRWFYFNMVQALGSPEDREEAIIGVPETRIVLGFRSRSPRFCAARHAHVPRK
jgi:hypothetical protein